MGWFGYGKYDGDETASTQSSFFEAVGFKNNIPLANGKTLGESWEFNPERDLLSDEVVSKVFTDWEAVSKKWLSKPKIKNGKIYWDSYDSDAIDHMMAADFFMNQKHPLPLGLKELALDAVSHLIHGGHADDFDKPSARKKVLNKFLEELKVFPEVSLDNLDIFVMQKPNYPEFYIVTNNKAKDVPLKEGDELHISTFNGEDNSGYSGYTVFDITNNKIYGTIERIQPKKSPKPR